MNKSKELLKRIKDYLSYVKFRINKLLRVKKISNNSESEWFRRFLIKIKPTIAIEEKANEFMQNKFIRNYIINKIKKDTPELFIPEPDLPTELREDQFTTNDAGRWVNCYNEKVSKYDKRIKNEVYFNSKLDLDTTDVYISQEKNRSISNKAEIIILPSSKRKFGGIYKKIKDIPNIDPAINVVGHLYLDDHSYYHNKEYYQPQDIYIVSNYKIMKNDYYFDGFKILKYKNQNIHPNFNKVIATSNISLNLPILPDSFNKEFISHYNMGNVPTKAYYDAIKNYISMTEFDNKRHFFTEK